MGQENLTPSQGRDALMAALGTLQVSFPAAWRTQNVLEMVQSPAGSSCVTIPMEGCRNPEGRLMPCSAGEEEWQILWAGAGREAQQGSYSSSGSQDNQGPSWKAATGLFYQIHPFKCIPLKREYKYCPENKLPYRTLPLKTSVF